MVVDPIQTSFAGGEISPRLRGRVESDLYKKGLATCENFQPTAQGSLLMRNGTRYAAPGSPGVLRAFGFPGTQGYLAKFYANGVIVYSADELLAGHLVLPGDPDEPSAELVTNGMFAGATGGDFSPPDWTEVGVDSDAYHFWEEGDALVALPVDGRLRQAVDVGLAGRYRLRFSLQAGRTFPIPINEPRPSLQRGAHCQLSLSTGDQSAEEYGTPGDLYDFQVAAAEDDDAWNNGLSAHYCVDLDLPAGLLYVMLSSWNPGYGVDGEVKQVGNALVTGVSLERIAHVHAFAGPWTAAQAAELQVAPRPDLSGIVIAHAAFAPQTLYVDAYGRWTLETVGFAAPTDDRVSLVASWGEGNWPSVVGSAQGRLWFGATPATPDGIWGSRMATVGPDAIFDFTAADPESAAVTPVMSDALSWRFVDGATVRWFAGRQSLLVGTDQGEYSAQGGTTGIMSALDLQVLKQSDRGGKGISPAAMGGQAAYVSQDGTRVFLVDFSNEGQAWRSRELSFTADHLFRESGGIVDLAFARDPDGMLAAVLEDGSLALCSYSLEAEVAAWWRGVVAGVDCQVHSVSVTHGAAGSYLWFNLSRSAGGETRKYAIERLRFGADDELLDGCAYRTAVVVAGAGGTVPEQVVSFTDLAHLDGQTTIKVLDPTTGEVLDGVSDTAGAVDVLLPEFETGLAEDSEVEVLRLVGCPYVATMKTLPLEGVSRRGTSQTTRRRFAKLQLRLADSGLPLVDGDRTKDANPATAAAAGVLQDRDAVATCRGWDEQGQVTIEQDLPCRTEILALFGVAVAGEV